MIFIVILTLFIIISIYTLKKYINNKRITYLTHNGVYYNELIILNQNVKYYIVPKHEYIHHSVKSKKSFENFDLTTIMLYLFENNTCNIKEYAENIKKNKIINHDYMMQYNKIVSKNYTYKNISFINTGFLSSKTLKKYELELVKKNKMKEPKMQIELSVAYTSPGGKKHYHDKYVLNNNEILEYYLEYLDNAGYKANVTIERNKMSSSLRYDILKRDNFKCKICGLDGQDGVKLEVDHILPVSKGGKTEPSNLQTLCEICNRGKSNKI